MAVMITQLKKRERVDALKNDVRAGGIAWGRYIYLGLLTGLFLFILNFFVGHLIFLRADGLVIKDSYTVSPLYTARIKAVNIKRGDIVTKDKVLIELESATLMQQLAQISTNVADLTSKTAQIKARTKVAKILLPTAREHANETTRILTKFKAGNNKDYITSTRFEEAMSNKLRANTNLSKLEAESSVFTEELGLIEDAQRDAKQALKNLKKLYNKGQVTSPVSGIIGSKLVSVGDVILPGTPMLRVYTGPAYILAFLPKSYFFSLKETQQVVIQSGALKAFGTIEAMLPLAASLPKEFQNSIKPTGRQRLMRIKIETKDHPFVIAQNIIIRAPWTNESIGDKIATTWKSLPILKKRYVVIYTLQRASLSARVISYSSLAMLNLGPYKNRSSKTPLSSLALFSKGNIPFKNSIFPNDDISLFTSYPKMIQGHNAWSIFHDIE